MKNIFFITTSVGFGGASKQLLFVAESMSKAGNQVSIINLQEGTYGHTRGLSNSIMLYEITSTRNGAIGRIEQIWKINKLLRKENADLIICFKQVPTMLGRVSGWITRTPVIMSERGDPFQANTASLRNKIIRFLANSCEGGVFQTEGAKSYYSKKMQKRGCVIPNPISIEEQTVPIDIPIERKKTVVTVGRLENKQKRYDIMLEAFAIFLDVHPEYNLEIYGDGPDMDCVRNWAKEKQIDAHVLFMGLTKDPLEKIKTAGMFLITSDYEGISNSLLEAMAVGLPVISTDSTPGGARMVIHDHYDGLLVPVRDPGAIANAMCEFAENNELSLLCEKNAQNVLRRFSPEKMSRKWIDYIDKILRVKERQWFFEGKNNE